MEFKEFITRQRVLIFVVGIATFIASLATAYIIGYDSLWSEFFVDLADSAIAVIFTALIVDYLSVKEQSNKTYNAAGLAEDEIRATCFRIKWRLARLYGYEPHGSHRDNISTRQEAGEYLERATKAVDDYLSTHVFAHDKISPDEKTFEQYIDRLEHGQTELEQNLILYAYAMPYSLRERVLALRSELQISDRILSFIDTSEGLNDDNLSLIRVTAESVYDAVETVLGHDSRTATGLPIHAKDSRLT